MSLKGYTVPQDDGGFDLTPMIDVVFLLIVFFMTVASMITEKKELNLAVADESIVPKEIGNRFTFSIDVDGSLYFGKQLLTAEQFQDKVVRIAKETPGVKLVLRIDRMTEHQYVNKALQVCAESGINDIIFATYQSAL